MVGVGFLITPHTAIHILFLYPFILSNTYYCLYILYICVYYISMPTYPLNYPTYPYFPTAFKYRTLSNLTAGDFVVVFNNGANELVVDKQVIDAFNPYFGFVVNNYTAGQTAEIYQLRVVNNQLSGLIPSATYYADPTTPGAVTNVLPTGTSIIQIIGIAINTTDLDTQYYRSIEGSGGGGGGLVCPTSDTLIDGGTFLSPCSNTLIDAGSF